MNLNLLLSNGIIPWVLLLVIGFPLALLVLGELVVDLEARKNAIANPLRLLRNWVLPSAALFILLFQVLSLPKTSSPVRFAETLLWITIIYSALTLLNVIFFESADAESWQAKVPQLLRDLARFVLILVGAAIVLSTVWGADLGGLLTALGVGSLVIGLALQDSLGNIFSGIALLFEQPVSLGDWIKIGEREGKVIAINWRSVHLLNNEKNVIVVPNSEIAKTNFINFSRPTRLCIDTLFVDFSCDDPPNKVIQLLTEAALEVEGILADPPPKVTVYKYNDFSINYRVRFHIADYKDDGTFRRELNARIWYVAKRNHLTMPYPIQTEVPYESYLPSPEKQRESNLSALRSVSGFASLPSPALEKVLKGSDVRDYARDEIVLAQGEDLPGLFLILEGEAKLIVSHDGLNAIGVLSPGEFFGEKSSLLSDRTTDVAVIAAEDLKVLLINNETLKVALNESPRLAQELGEVMELRRRALQNLHRAGQN